MKKTALFILLGLFCVSAFAGCSSKEGAAEASSVSSSAESASESASSESTSESQTGASSESADTSSEEKEFEFISGEFTPKDCVVLPEYKGLSLINTVYVASDEYIDTYIGSLAETEELTDENAQVQTGDTVNIAFEGTIDGETFEGGSSESYDLKIGSGRFIDGFEDGLIGMKKGDETDLDLVFPEDYGNSEFNGKPVVFHVVINSINRPVEQDDEWVKEFTDGQYSGMDDFRAYVEKNANESLALNAETTLYNNAWSEVYDKAEFKALPEAYIAEGKEMFMSNAETEAETYGFTSVEDYFETAGMTQDDIDDYAQSYAESYAMSRILAEAILEAEGISTDGEEINAVYEKLADDYGITVDELMETYGQTQAQLYALCQTANKVIVDNADVTEETEEYNG
jgi:trigger factor